MPLSRLRVLVVSPYLPSRRSGGPVRLRGLVSALAASHAVSVVAYESAAVEHAGSAEEVRAFCEEVTTVHDQGIGMSGATKRALQLRSILSTRSFAHVVYGRRTFQEALDRVVARRRYDLVHVEQSCMTYLRFPRNTPVVLDEQNIEYEVLRRTVAVAGTLSRRVYNYLDYLKLKAEEERAWRRADGVALTSARDEAILKQTVPGAATAVVPNAADTGFFRPSNNRAQRWDILFFGTLNYYPNTDGLLFFLREVMPLLKRSYPLLRLVIVGSSPPPAIRRFAGPDVVITGAVDDVRPYLARAQVVIAPLRIGGGTRLKILEAMAMGRPVVSTTLGAEGLAVTHERDILIGDGADAFAAQVGRALEDDRLGESLGSAARRLVLERYDWSASARALEDLYRRVLVARSSAAVGPEGVVAPARGGDPATNSINATP